MLCARRVAAEFDHELTGTGLVVVAIDCQSAGCASGSHRTTVGDSDSIEGTSTREHTGVVNRSCVGIHHAAILDPQEASASRTRAISTYKQILGDAPYGPRSAHHRSAR